MQNTYNTQNRLPYGMSNVIKPDYIRAGQFLYSQYPGIHKMRIKPWKVYDKKGVQIKLITTGTVRRNVSARGYSLANTVGNLIRKIKEDQNLTEHLRYPEKFC